MDYSDVIRHWAADTRRAGNLEHADGTGEIGLNTGEAGTRLAVRFALRLHGDRAEMVRYQVFGCGFTMAACAAAAELAEGRSLEEVAAVTAAAVETLLAGLPPERSYCAALATQGLRAAVQSARSGLPKRAVARAADEQPAASAGDPVYRLLVGSPRPPGATPGDRHLFACLIASAGSEAASLPAALSLQTAEAEELLRCYFPDVRLGRMQPPCPEEKAAFPQPDADLLLLLNGYLPRDSKGSIPKTSLWLARSIAVRAARPGHLWRAMGLFARIELTNAIEDHLPLLAEANSRRMRWKRFLFKQLCEKKGGTLCRAPDCGTCSDYALCFETDQPRSPAEPEMQNPAEK